MRSYLRKASSLGSTLLRMSTASQAAGNARVKASTMPHISGCVPGSLSPKAPRMCGAAAGTESNRAAGSLLVIGFNSSHQFHTERL